MTLGTPTTPVTRFATRVIENIETVIIGKRLQLEYLIVALLCRGHVLIEDVPGTGKTMLARAVAATMGLSFNRVQCTPDLLPNDVIGLSIYDQRTNTFEFRPGPVLVNILLTDEIVRATRSHDDIAVGASPRGSLALYKSAQALAALRGRDYVSPDDVKEMARLTLPHRLIVRPESQLRGRTAETIVDGILDRVVVSL